MKISRILLICLLLTGCGLSSEQITATVVSAQTQTQRAAKTSTPPATSTPNLTETQKATLAAAQTKRSANIQATQTVYARPTVTAIARAMMILDKIKIASQEINELDFSKARLVYGPKDDKLIHELNDKVVTYNPELSLDNFIVSISFINPYDTSNTGTWDYGILFRNQYGNNQYRLVILSNQSWSLRNSKTKTYIYRANDKNINAKGGEANTIWLICIGSQVHLFINGIYTKSLDISAEPLLGDISPATGIFYGNLNEERNTEFKDFMVWSLP